MRLLVTDAAEMPTGVAAAACVVGHVVAGGLVQVAEQDLLVVERELGDGSRLEHPLGRLEGVAVLQRVLLERDGGELLAQPLAWRSSAARSRACPRRCGVLYDVGQ